MPSFLQKIANAAAGAASSHTDTSVPQQQQARQYYLASMQTTHPRKRKRLLRKAARLGDRISMLELGKCYEMGKGTHQQLGKAIELYKTAHCWYNLGMLVEKYLKDQKKAQALYKKALGREDDDVLKAQRVKAAYRLGNIILKEAGENVPRLMEARRCFVVAAASEAIIKVDQELERLTGQRPAQDRILPPPPVVQKLDSANESTTPSSQQRSKPFEPPQSNTSSSQVNKQSLPPVPNIQKAPPPVSSTATIVVDDLLVFDDSDDTSAEKVVDDLSILVSQQQQQPILPQKTLQASIQQTPLETPLSMDDFYVDDDEMDAAFADYGFQMDSSARVEHNTTLSSTSSSMSLHEANSNEIIPIDVSKFPRTADPNTVRAMQECMKHLAHTAFPQNSEVLQHVDTFVGYIETSPEIEVLTAVAENKFHLLLLLSSKFVAYTFSAKPNTEVVDRMLNAFVILIQMNKLCAQAFAFTSGFSHMCFDLLTEGIHEDSEDKVQLAMVTVFETFSLDSLPSREHIDESNKSTLSMILSTLIASFEKLPQPLGTLDILSLVPFIGGEVPRSLCSLAAFPQGYLTSLNDSLCKAHIRFIEYLPRDGLRQMFSLNDMRNIVDMCERQVRDRSENDELHRHLVRFVDELNKIVKEWG